MPTTLEQLQYGFDRDSRRTWRQRATTQGWDNAYVYDSLSQVIGDDGGDLNQAHNAIAGIPSNAARWQYDETGNWHGYETLAYGTATLSQARTHDKGNRLMEVSEAATMRTDRAGRMVEAVPGPNGDWNSSWTIKWDAWGRIVELDSQGISAAYAYDGLTRRISRYTNLDDVTLHSYYNDEWRPVEDRRNAGTMAEASYLWGGRHRDDLVRRDRATTHVALNETRYVLMDYFSPAAITDENGEVTERYQFSAFGLRIILNPDFTVRAASECAMEFSFQGQFEDIETGWMNYGYRYYLPALGRWACKDPIGEIGGMNLYEMTNNDALNQTDFIGLDPVSSGSFSGSGRNFGEPRGPASPVEAMIHKAGLEALEMSMKNKKPEKAPVEYCGQICCSKTKGLYRTGPIRGLQDGCYWVMAPCEEGDQMVGIYHSHPNGGTLSGEDIKVANDQNVPIGATRNRPGNQGAPNRTDGYNPNSPSKPFFSEQ